MSDSMDINSVASGGSLSLPLQVSATVLAKNLDVIEQTGASMIQMMEQSVNPELGQSIDVRI